MVSVHRITQTSIATSSLRGLQGAQSQVAALQNQLATGKKLAKPSDDPAGLTSAMQLRSQLRQDDRYLDTIGAATDRLNTADTALQGVTTQLNRAKQLMSRATGGSLDAAAREAIATELDVIRQGVIDDFNTGYGGRPVFGGSAPGSAAIDGSGAYVGDDADLTARVARNVTVRVDVKGSAVGADVLPDLLAKAAADIRSNSTTDVMDDQNQLDGAFTKVTTALGDIGARVSQIQSTRTRITSEQVDLTTRIAGLENIDPAEPIVQLSSAQLTYQSALGAAAKVMQTSLLDYLR